MKNRQFFSFNSKAFTWATCILCLLIILRTPAEAIQDRWFEVEVLIFKHLSTLEEDAEVFPVEVSEINTRGSIDLIRDRLNPQKHKGMLNALPLCSWLPDQLTGSQGFQLNTKQPSRFVFDTLPEFTSKEVFCKYQAERLIVDRLQPSQLPDPGLHNVVRLPALIAGEGGDMEKQSRPFLMPADALTLNTYKNRMEQRGMARTLLHTSWRQPVYNRSRSQLIRLFGGFNFADEFSYDGFPLAPLSAKNPEPAHKQIHSNDGLFVKEQQNHHIQMLLSGIESGEFSFIAPEHGEKKLPEGRNSTLQSQPTEVWELDGHIRIYLIGNYLHIEPSLQVREPDLFSQQRSQVKEQAKTWLEGQVKEITFLRAYPMKQRKRVISHELHYFDHPKFGMLIEIRRTDRSGR